MAKKQSGLGRGLGDLLADNTPEVRGGGTVVRKQEGESVVITPSSGGEADAPKTQPAVTPKPLYEERPQNRSLKANFKGFNKK